MGVYGLATQGAQLGACGGGGMSPIPTFDEVLDYMRRYGGTLRLRATVPGGADPVCNIPAEVAIFAAPTCPGGCMVWGRSDLGWHPNHGERSAVSILLAMKEQA